MREKRRTSYLPQSILLVVTAIIVNIALGHLVQFVLQSPLFLYVRDPRTDVPDTFQAHLEQVIEGRDEVIVAGWMQMRNGISNRLPHSAGSPMASK